MSKAKGFTFFENYYESISDPENGLTDEQRGLIYNAIITYVFTGKLLELKGVCRGFFNLIRPSLDVSRSRSDSGSKKANAEETDVKSEAEEQQTENKSKSNEQQTKNKRETKDDFSPFFENDKNEQEREYKNKNKKNEQEREEGAGGGENPLSATERTERSFVQEKFFKEHPEIDIDNYPAGLASEIDFEVLSAEISKSEYLRGTRSFAWICKNYRKIALGQYRDYAKSTDPPTEDTSAEQEREREWNEKHGKGAGT